MELPKEIEWNIIKFMSHPIADIMRPLIQQFRHGKAHDFYFEQGMDYSRKHFHLVVLDTIRDDKLYWDVAQEDAEETERWNRALAEIDSL